MKEDQFGVPEYSRSKTTIRMTNEADLRSGESATAAVNSEPPSRAPGRSKLLGFVTPPSGTPQPVEDQATRNPTEAVA